jgi:putative ABC transport system permease protein
MSLILRLAWRELTNRRVRTILTLLGLAIGVVSATSFDLIGTSVYQSSLDTYQSSVATDVVVFHQAFVINETIINSVENLTSYEVGLQIFLDGQVATHSGTVQGIGLSNINKLETKTHLSGIYLLEGRIPGENEVLIDFSEFHELNLKLGDSLIVKTRSGEKQLEIVGIAADPAAESYNFRTGLRIYSDLSFLQKLDQGTNMESKTNLIFLEFSDETDLDVVSKQIVTILIKNEIAVINVTQKDLESDWRSSFLALFSSFADIVSITGLVIGGIFTANTLTMTILQSKKEIGIMKTLGGKPNFLIKVYFTQITIYGLLGAVIGIPLSILLAYFLMQFYASSLNLTVITLLIPVGVILKGFLLSLTAAYIFGIIPAVKASKQKTIKSIREDSNTESTKYRTRIRGNDLFFAIRNLRRNKFRSNIILITIVLSLGIGIGTTTALDSSYAFTNNWIDDLDFDFTVGFALPLNETPVDRHFNTFFQIYYPEYLDWAEGSLWLPANLILDDERTQISFAGVWPGGNAYQSFELVDGRKFEVSDLNTSNVIITAIYADKYSISVGDKIQIQNPLQTESFNIIGVVQDLYNQGGVIYVPIDTLRTYYQVQDIINSYLIKLNDPEIVEEVQETLENLSAEFNFNLQTKEYWTVVAQRQVNFFRLFALTVQFLTTFITIVGSTNIILMIAMERRREFSVIKMIGGRPRHVFKMLNLEAGLIGFFAGVFAIPVIYYLGQELLFIASSQLAPGIPFIFGFSQIIMSLFLGTLTGILSSIIPSIWVTKSSVLNGLRYE